MSPALPLLLIALSPHALGGPLPPPLEPWVPWVLSQHEELACPAVDGAPACLWPGNLSAEVTDEGGSFAMTVRVDRSLPVALPGGRGTWPQEVQVDGMAAAVFEREGVPMVALEAGAHTLRGTWRWPALPSALPLPGQLARVDLILRGVPVPWPRVTPSGTLLLGEGASSREERLELDVSRKIADGVPVRVTTRLDLRAAGGSREVDLGEVLLPDTAPVQITSPLPARLDPAGHLLVQLRPGTWTVEIEALHLGPARALSRPGDPVSGWPERESWAVATDSAVRAVNLSGPPAIDPSRTSLPEAWRGLPAFLVGVDQPLRFEELRRGEPEPPPNQLHLVRELWLDSSGEGFTVQDRISGTMNRGWRLDLSPPGHLGHLQATEEDQVITAAPSGSGVELRTGQVDVVAESRLPRTGTLPAVGWNADANHLESVIHLPPGWALLTAAGADEVTGSLLSAWTLLDLLLVSVLSLGFWRMYGIRWGATALVGLALSRHLPGDPTLLWIPALALGALERVLPAGHLRAWGRAAHLVSVAALALALLPFAITGMEIAHAPATARDPVAWAPADSRGEQNAVQDYGALQAGLRASPVSSVSRSRNARAEKAYVSLQQDPAAVVQTGPGLPRWRWDEARLTWRGPVQSGHQLALYLIGPIALMALAWIRVLALVALALRVVEPRRLPWRALVAAAPLLLLGPLARAQTPSAELLKELESRLTQPASCAPDCVSVPHLTVRIDGAHLVLEGEVHAAALSTWPLPGPAEVWTPTEVLLDGASAAIARQADGAVHLRLPQGVHRLEARGPLPGAQAITLQFGLPPQRLEFKGEGWTLEGVRSDGAVESSVQLTRDQRGDSATGGMDEPLSPWLTVTRELDLGIPWRAVTTVRREGSSDRPLTLRIPLLPGESVTEEGVAVQDGAVLLSLGRGQSEARWIATLAETEQLTLHAPEGVSWTEAWQVSCSPVYACEADGPAPLRHVQDGRWSPLWRPWPGETVQLRAHRPPPVDGATVTIEAATLRLKPGRRLTEGSLDLEIRSSQGGTQIVTLPEGAKLSGVIIDGQRRPLQLRGGELAVPLHPGAQTASLSWQEPSTAGLRYQAPAVHVHGPIANAWIYVEPPSDRWVFALQGPRWGPTPLIWSRLLEVLAISLLLGRVRGLPIGTLGWLLLGLGTAQLPLIALAVLVVWFLAVGARSRSALRTWWRLDLVQLTLLGLTGIAALTLYIAVHVGLLLRPDMDIVGNASTAYELRWLADRVEGGLPRPVVWSAPIWVWRVGMLAWSLWLVARLTVWLPWAWRATGAGGRLALPALHREEEG
ncbi:MAG: hypothetical protein JXX28_02150 [Deltaproteobacteria bacterium]|nr:hypothetical protein [Deltaproteobacteria bacterium]